MENKPKVLTDKYEVGRLLGQGGFAKVYFGRHVDTRKSVAIKVIDKEKLYEQERPRVDVRKQVKREISIMRIIKHPNVVEIYEVIATKDRICLVIEYCRGGDLCTKMENDGKLSEKAALKYFCQLINAFEFCHSRGIYHRDIKLENMLLDDNDNLKVSDFGLSTLADCRRQDGLFHTGCGSRDYIPPEVLRNRGYDGAKADIWSCGVVLFFLLANSKPFYHRIQSEMERRIIKADYKCPPGFPSEAKSLLAKMLEPNPETRITISNIKESPWFKKHLFSKVREPSIFISSENPEPPQLAKLNAFDILGLSTGTFNVSGLLGDYNKKKESSFTSQNPASEIISKLKEVAKSLKMKIKKQREGLFKLEGSTEGLKGIVSMNAEIFQVTETFHLVEVKKGNGDTLEYQKLVEENLRPALKDIVWVWQGEKEKDEQPQGGLQDEREEQEPLSLTEAEADDGEGEA